MSSRLHSVDRGLVVASVVLTATLFTAQAADPVNLVKLTALALCAIGLVASAAARTVRHRVVRAPWGAAAWAAAALLLGLIVSAAVAPVTTTAVLGAYGRNSGLLAYASAIVVLLAALRVFRGPHLALLLGAVLAAALFTASYGGLQRLGIDAIAWNNEFNPIIASLGNPNFASGYLGVGACVAVGGALWRGWARAWRVASGVTGVLCLVVAAASNSVQGPIAAAAGLCVVALAWALEQPVRRRTPALGALGLVVLAGASTLVLGLAQRGPAAPVFSDGGGNARRSYWDAALSMFTDNPLTGVGLDQFGGFWWSSRSVQSLSSLGTTDFTNAAHSVPLQMLAQGGLVLGGAYLVFVLLVLVALVRGLLTRRGPDRLLLGAFGGGWLAYQMQSAVSIDQVPLIVLHFALAAGVLLAADAVPLREWRLPGAPVVAPPVRPSRRTPVVLSQPWRPLDVALTAGIAVLGLVAAWQALVPLRADAAVANGDQRLAAGDGTQALIEYQQATELLPGQALYLLKHANLLTSAEQDARALVAYDQAAARDPYNVPVLRAAGVARENAGDIDGARTLFNRLVEVDPYNPESIALVASFELRHSGAVRARDLLDEVVAVAPLNALSWAKLGDARAVLKDEAGARAAYARALEIQPGEPVATEGLVKLDR